MSIYHLITAFLFLLYILGIFQFGFEKVAWQFLPPVIVTTLVGAILDYVELKRWTIPKTPFITGLIIGLIGQFGESALKLSIIGVVAMSIKFFIKWEGRHIFNPAAAGIFAGMIIFNSYPSWWSGGGSIWPFLIWIPVFLYKFKRWAPMAGFLLPVVPFSGISIFSSSSLLFFLSVMLIEPKTSPADVKLGFIYGLLVGVAYFLFSQTSFDPLIISLLIGNLTYMILRKVIK